MAGEAVASPMRLATVPGRSARPAPPGNDDPCEERRTIPEGLPRLPREAFARGLRRAVLNPPKPSAKEDRQRQARARARNPTWSAVKASVPVAGLRKTPRRKPGWLVWIAHIERGRGLAVVRNERKAGICSGLSFDEASARRSWWANMGCPRRHPSATGAPHAPREGAAIKEEANSE